jgi:hypothetical protein
MDTNARDRLPTKTGRARSDRVGDVARREVPHNVFRPFCSITIKGTPFIAASPLFPLFEPPPK